MHSILHACSGRNRCLHTNRSFCAARLTLHTQVGLSERSRRWFAYGLSANNILFEAGAWAEHFRTIRVTPHEIIEAVAGHAVAQTSIPVFSEFPSSVPDVNLRNRESLVQREESFHTP